MEQQHGNTAVIAHGLLGSVSFVIDAARRLADTWEGPDEGQQVLLDRLDEHAAHIKNVLNALVRGLPHDAYH
ncbi:MAG: hypothetical protein JO148_01465 [Acidimicrobiia bacterium]|nr:hypothetical protein [Acidimicrobiia bacterium]